MKRTEQSTGVLQIDSQAKSLIETAAVLRGQVVAKEVQIQAMRSYRHRGQSGTGAWPSSNWPHCRLNWQKIAGAGQESGSDFIVPKGRVPEAGMEYLRKLRDVKYYETIYELIAKQFEMAKLDEARQGAVIQVADVAVPPDKKSWPPRLILTILALVLGFMGACGWCVFRERIERMKQDPAARRRLEDLRATLR